MKQLAQRSLHLPEKLLDLYDEYASRGTKPSRKDFVEALQLVILGFSKTYIFVDALDECSEESGTRLEIIEDIQALSGSINLLVTLRYIPSIEREFSQARRIDIHAKEEDLRTYVLGRIPWERRLLSHVKSDPSLQDLIANKIVGNVAGM